MCVGLFFYNDLWGRYVRGYHDDQLKIACVGLITKRMIEDHKTLEDIDTQQHLIDMSIFAPPKLPTLLEPAQPVHQEDIVHSVHVPQAPIMPDPALLTPEVTPPLPSVSFSRLREALHGPTECGLRWFFGITSFDPKTLVSTSLFLSTFVLSIVLSPFWLIATPFTGLLIFFRLQYKAISRACVDTTIHETITHMQEKTAEVREKALWWIPGWEGFGNGTKNWIATAFTGVTLTAVGIILWKTIAWIKSKKNKIKEGKTPIDLAYDFLPHILGVCAFFGILAGATIRINSFIGAVKHLNAVWGSFTTSAWKKTWRKGKLSEVSSSFNDFYPDVLSGRVICKDEYFPFLLVQSRNLSHVWIKDVTKEKILLEFYRNALYQRYPGIQISDDFEIDWNLSASQIFLNDILAQDPRRNTNRTFNLYLAMKWNVKMTHVRNVDGAQARVRSVMYDNLMHRFNVSNENQFPFYVAGHLDHFVHIHDPGLKYYDFVPENGPSTRILAKTPADAEETYSQTIKDDPAPYTLLDNIQSFISEHQAKIIGLMGIIVVVYIATFYWYQNKWNNKKKEEDKKKESVETDPEAKTGGSKGQHIKAAQDYRENQDFKKMCQERDELRQKTQDLRNFILDVTSHGSADDEDLLDNARRSLSVNSKNLAKLTMDCDSLYNAQFDAVNKPSHKKQTRVNNVKSMPNSDKPRKQKEEVITIDTDNRTIDVVAPAPPVAAPLCKCGNTRSKELEYCTPCIHYINTKESKAKKECVHYSTCPAQIKTCADTICEKNCGGKHCVHFAGCTVGGNKEGKDKDDFKKSLSPPTKPKVDQDCSCLICAQSFKSYLTAGHVSNFKLSNKTKQDTHVSIDMCSKCKCNYYDHKLLNKNDFINMTGQEIYNTTIEYLRSKQKKESVKVNQLPLNKKKDAKTYVVKEAIHDKSQNPQSVSHPTPAAKDISMIPMYIYTEDHYKHNGMITVGKYKNNRFLLTCTHQLRDSRCYIRKPNINIHSSDYNPNDGFMELIFNRHYDPDVSIMEMPNSLSVKGEVLEIAALSEKETSYMMYTFDLKDLTKQQQVYLSNMHVDLEEDNEGAKYINHKSDTLGGQCGSPYVALNRITALHNNSISDFNRGIILPSKFFSDF